MKAAIAKLVEGNDLDVAEMTAVVGTIMDGEATPAAIAAFLTALRMKGESVDELVAAVEATRARALRLDVGGPLLDTCGTGGDGRGTFNISTASAFVCAAGGARVAKHGNRAASSRVGAADVLEAAGAVVDLAPAAAARVLDAAGITFLFAPRYHPGARHAAGPRREIGIRTLFNLVGPMSNPAGARRQVLGVFSPEWLEPVAEALGRLGCEHALLVHGADGTDEITTTGITRAVELRDAAVRRLEITPDEFGIPRSQLGDIAGGDADRNVAILRAVLEGRPGPAADAVALNAGAGLYVAGLCPSLAAGVAAARKILASGEAGSVLEKFVAATRECTR